MAATCSSCRTTIRSFRDIIALGSAETRRIWSVVVEKIPYLGDVFCGGGVSPLSAGPLNQLHAPCPQCLAVNHWVEPDEGR